MVQRFDADIGVAFDGDADRLGVVTKEGTVVFPDRLLMLFAADVLQRNPGALVIYDVKCTGKLSDYVLRNGGSPLMWKTGHSLIKSKMRETDAELAGEMSGHFFFKERWYGFDDGIYAAARLLEIFRPERADPVRGIGRLARKRLHAGDQGAGGGRCACAGRAFLSSVRRPAENRRSSRHGCRPSMA